MNTQTVIMKRNSSYEDYILRLHRHEQLAISWLDPHDLSPRSRYVEDITDFREIIIEIKTGRMISPFFFGDQSGSLDFHREPYDQRKTVYATRMRVSRFNPETDEIDLR